MGYGVSGTLGTVFFNIRCRQTLSKILLLAAIADTSKTSLNPFHAKLLCGFVPIAQSASVVATCDRPQLHQDQ